MKDDAGLDDRDESKLFNFDAIPAGRQIGNVIYACLIGETMVMNPGAGVDHLHCGCADNRPM